MHSIQMVLKDNSSETEMETAKTLYGLQRKYGLTFGNKIRPGSWGSGEYFQSTLKYNGHFCSTHDVNIIFQLDESGVLEKNVKAFYVYYPEALKYAYYDVGYIMRKIERDRIKREDERVSSGFISLFGR